MLLLQNISFVSFRRKIFWYLPSASLFTSGSGRDVSDWNFHRAAGIIEDRCAGAAIWDLCYWATFCAWSGLWISAEPTHHTEGVQ